MKWSRENYYHNLSSPYCLRLASGDASGKIIVWDVVSGTAHCEIQEHSKPIQGTRFYLLINSPCINIKIFSALPSISFNDPFVFLCQTWSGCGIRMHLVICCWPFTHPTILFYGMETQAPSCGKRAMLRTSFHFLLIPLTPPTWHVSHSASCFRCFTEFSQKNSFKFS